MKISRIRPVLLTAPYSDPEDSEVLQHLPGGVRTCGLVEVTLEDGTTGIGEGYMAVFAPEVFVALIELYAPLLEGQDGFNVRARYRQCCRISDYFSMAGAARHAISAIEIALWDAKGKALGTPVFDLLGGPQVESLAVYASAGDGVTPRSLRTELKMCAEQGIGILKIRALHDEIEKTRRALGDARELGVRIAVDMCQNLAQPSQTPQDVLRYLAAVSEDPERDVAFLEEALGPTARAGYAEIRRHTSVPLAGGETLTTEHDFYRLIDERALDFVQPDATVVGGIGPLHDIARFAAARGVPAVVHNWGSSVGVLANYHVAAAVGAELVELPIKPNPLREALAGDRLAVRAGCVTLTDTPGLGVELTEETESRYPFQPAGTYRCDAPRVGLPDDETWLRD